MQIDCHTCPGRPLACDGCMVQVLFWPVSSANEDLEGGATVTKPEPDPMKDINQAIDAFVDAAMITRQSAISARKGIVAARGGSSSGVAQIRRAG